jgi:predicted nucleotidyltransferase
MIRLPSDFSEFLKLLNSSRARYLLIGGYAVNYYGYSRSTGDMDIWISCDINNATLVAGALRQFGFEQAEAEPLSHPNRVLRMGVQPIRLEILTSISGVEFEDCFARRELVDMDGCSVPVIHLSDLKRNKRASGRAKDLADLEELEARPSARQGLE